jgi:hypothetical protein
MPSNPPVVALPPAPRAGREVADRAARRLVLRAAALASLAGFCVALGACRGDQGRPGIGAVDPSPARPGGAPGGHGNTLVAPGNNAVAGGAPGPSGASAGGAAPLGADGELAACEARIAGATATPSLAGSPGFDGARAEFLGRARGEPVLFVEEPAATAEAAVPDALRASWRELRAGPPGARVARVARRHGRDPAALRALLLRDGYLFAPEPLDALALATELHLGQLFDAPEIWLMRGAEIRKLALAPASPQRKAERAYRYVDGPLQGKVGEVLFADRIALSPEGLARPLHRDLRGLADAAGFDRMKVLHRGSTTLVAELRFGDGWVKALLEGEGAALRVSCLAAPAPERERVAAFLRADAPRRAALAGLSSTVDAIVGEGLRFDRPEGEKTAERDGQLRPMWLSSYLRGGQAFSFEGQSYPVYDVDGRPHPPEVCVDFVLDCYERAAGTWFTQRPAPPARVRGKLDFDALGIKNRRGVLAFERFASQTPDLFETRTFKGAERVPFGQRSSFFGFLLDHADELRPGDVLAIQGVKRDGLIHQHAILLERTDPLTGFAYGLADQMKRPRRRTWEGIMAEAPRRSLLYRVRPRDPVLLASADADRLRGWAGFWPVHPPAGRCPCTPGGALPLHPRWGAAPTPPVGRCPCTPGGALPLHPRWGAAPTPPVGRCPYTPGGALPLHPGQEKRGWAPLLSWQSLIRPLCTSRDDLPGHTLHGGPTCTRVSDCVRARRCTIVPP